MPPSYRPSAHNVTGSHARRGRKSVKSPEVRFPTARIPYGAWGSSYFPAWQVSPLAEVNMGPFAAEAMNRILGLRGIPTKRLEYLITGSTIPWHWKFWNSPMLASCMDHRIAGYHVEQACATGLQATAAALSEIESGSHSIVGVLTFDRTSDSSVGVFPERRAHQRTIAISDVWDNFGFDPATGKAMIAAAGNATRKYRLDRKEIDELAFCRSEQYFESQGTSFGSRYLVPLEVLNTQGRSMGTIDHDLGARPLSLSALNAMRELDSGVTSGTQTHAADGMACLVAAHKDRLGELTRFPEIQIQMVAKEEVRTLPSLMPEAPMLAARKILQTTGVALDDISTIKTHNPFAINDLIFAKELRFDWRRMNNHGCSLVWGHPQGPTLTRLIVEGLEETVDHGGGYCLVLGCAAGDVGTAALFSVKGGR